MKMSSIFKALQHDLYQYVSEFSSEHLHKQYEVNYRLLWAQQCSSTSCRFIFVMSPL